MHFYTQTSVTWFIPFIVLSGFVYLSQIFISVFFGMNICVRWNLSSISYLYLAFMVDRLLLKYPEWLGSACLYNSCLNSLNPVPGRSLFPGVQESPSCASWQTALAARIFVTWPPGFCLTTKRTSCTRSCIPGACPSALRIDLEGNRTLASRIITVPGMSVSSLSWFWIYC